DSTEPESSPGSQRALHQKKMRRRSSGIPPPNFDDPQDASPSSDHASPIRSAETGNSGDLVELDDDTIQSVGSSNSTSSSARLDAALKQAAMYAGTHNIGSARDIPPNPDDDEVVGAFKPWTGKNARD